MRSLIFGALLVLTGCVGTYESSGTTTIDNSFLTTGFQWQGGPVIYFFVKARNNGGVTEVCGAWAPDGEDVISIRLNDEAIGTAILMSGGDTLTQGAAFLNELQDPRDVNGKTANCVTTSRPWKDSYAQEIETRMPPAAFNL